MTDPFAEYVPEPVEYGPTIKLSAVGDFFKGKIKKIGDLKAGEYGDFYFLDIELTAVNLTALPADPVNETPAYDPPKVGEVASFRVQATKANGSTHHVQEEIDRASRRADKNGVDVEDDLAGKLIDKIKSTKNPSYKPFRKHAFIVTPGAGGDPFKGTDQPPF